MSMEQLNMEHNEQRGTDKVSVYQLGKRIRMWLAQEQVPATRWLQSHMSALLEAYWKHYLVGTVPCFVFNYLL